MRIHASIILLEHFEGVDLTTVNASATGFTPIEDGDWGYGPTNEYRLSNNGNQEYLKITVTTPPVPVVIPYTPYEYTDLIYRNDAQDASSYTLVNTNEVNLIIDLCGGDVHNFNQVLGNNQIPGTIYGEPANWTPMILETAINGHPCFDGFLMQGVHGMFSRQPGNVVKKNMSESFTWIHVARLTSFLGQWAALFTYGKDLDSVCLSCNQMDNNTLFPCYAGIRLNDASLPNANNILLNKNILVIYRVFEKSSGRLQIWDIDNPSVPIIDATSTITLENQRLFVVNAEAMPFYIGATNQTRSGLAKGYTGHIHGETVLYNSYLAIPRRIMLKNFY
jgi:hypothetical protein